MSSRTPEPGTVAVVTMMQRPAVVALYDGEFWRSCDKRGPIKCAPSAITSIETPYVFDPHVMVQRRPVSNEFIERQKADGYGPSEQGGAL